MYKFQYYPANIKKCKPLGYTSIKELIKLQKEPNSEMIDIFKKIAEAEAQNDMKLKASLKQENLLYFTPCVHIKDWRKYDNITEFTGLLVLDFDHLDNAEGFKIYLFNRYPFIISTWLSPSKKGVKALVKIPVIQVQKPIEKSIEEFKEYFNAITEIMEGYEGFDEINKNPAQPLFQSYDSELLFRENAIVFTKRKQKPEFAFKPSIQPIPILNSNEKKEAIIRMVTRKMNRIVGNGHPQLLKISYTLGGYVGSGYLTIYEAEKLIHELIERNEYLSKDIPGYKKTASTCIRDGIKRPIRFGVVD